MHFHGKKENKDRLKNEKAENEGITLIRLREDPLEKIRDHDVIVSREKLVKDDINKLIESIRNCISTLPDNFNEIANAYLSKKRFVASDLYQAYIKISPLPFQKNRLSHLNLTSRLNGIMKKLSTSTY